jgi:Capsule polysaccharide biosynthesis protein
VIGARPRPMRICIYAYSTTAYFFRALIDACGQAGDAIEWSVVLPQGHFRPLFRKSVPKERQCYLYADFASRYAACDEAAVERALAARGGLVRALMKDKDGYRHLDKAEQLRRAATMHFCYADFLDRVRPDFVLFPDLEVVDGFVLMSLARARGIGVLYFASLRLLARSFFAADAYESLPRYFGACDDDDRAAAREMISRFRARQSREPGASYPAAPPPRPSLWRRVVVSAWLRHRTERLHASEETLLMRFTRNFLGPMGRLRRRRFEITAARYFDPAQDVPARYLYYALHYTPESSINGLEPYYADQLRVIDALLLNLPAGHRLVVKEHPAMVGMRPNDFYRDLRRRPGLVLLHPSGDSRALAEGAALVVTVTGTVGLEAWLMGKPCLMFGPTFFAHLCRKAPALGELGAAIAELVAAHAPASEEEKEIEIAKLLAIGADFTIGDPWFEPSVLATENVAAARGYLLRHLARLETAA